MKRFFFFLSAIPVVTIFFAISVSAVPKANDPKNVFEKKCGSCHGLDKTTSKKKTKNEWESTVQRMKKNGADLNDSEIKTIVDFLSAKYGKK